MYSVVVVVVVVFVVTCIRYENQGPIYDRAPVHTYELLGIVLSPSQQMLLFHRTLMHISLCF